MKFTATKDTSAPGSLTSKPFFSRGDGTIHKQARETHQPFFSPAVNLQKSIPANEAMAGESEPDQLRDPDEVKTTAMQVTAVFRNGATKPSVGPGKFEPNSNTIIARQRVAPTGSPTITGSGGNSCTPGVETLTWNVVDAGANWRANVQSLNISGEVHITPWPSNPNSMTVPNTANPVDGGNINNTAGSANHWQTVIDDMADYDTAGGGAGPNWHSTAASRAHEMAHWTGDYLGDAIPTGNWVLANQEIDSITVPKAANATAAAARTALTPLVDGRFNTFVAALTVRWNRLIGAMDTPGAGGRGYVAGTAVLNGLITRVRAYARSKGW